LWEKGTLKSCLFCQVFKTEATWQNLLASSVAPQPKAKAPQPSTKAFPTKGNSNKNAKKKEHNANKKKVFQAHVGQIQTL
jgi:hypothetical protein